MIRFNRQPEAAKRALNSFSVRSFPPEKSIITRSMTFAGSYFASAGTTLSTTSSFPPLVTPARHDDELCRNLGDGLIRRRG